MAKLLEVKGLTKIFGGLIAVNNLSFYVEKGEILGLMGPNGSGKTTVFNLIIGDFKQDSGEIFFGGKEISKYPTHQRVKMGIARTYQVPRPFHEMTVMEDIEIGTIPDDLIKCVRAGKEYGKEIREIGESVGLKERLSMYPYELSMGDLRRLELGRAMATNPKIILLDEIFAGLTVAEIDEISALIIKKREEGLDFIIVSHDLRALAHLVDRVVVIHFGEFVAEGSYEEIVNNEKVKEAYFGY
jgi:ABC-type branched-subunit amino acid transport system ATPase component